MVKIDFICCSVWSGGQLKLEAVAVVRQGWLSSSRPGPAAAVLSGGLLACLAVLHWGQGEQVGLGLAGRRTETRRTDFGSVTGQGLDPSLHGNSTDKHTALSVPQPGVSAFLMFPTLQKYKRRKKNSNKTPTTQNSINSYLPVKLQIIKLIGLVSGWYLFLKGWLRSRNERDKHLPPPPNHWDEFAVSLLRSASRDCSHCFVIYFKRSAAVKVVKYLSQCSCLFFFPCLFS